MAKVIRGKSNMKVTNAQAEVYDALRSYAGDGGWPDHVLVPVVQHTGALHQHSSGIRTRRLELERLGLIQCTGEARTNSGRKAAAFRALA